MKIKVSEASGRVLDWMVNQADEEGEEALLRGTFLVLPRADSDGGNIAYSPSSYWEQGGPIIERETICIDAGDGSFAPLRKWAAWIAENAPLKAEHEICGPTPLIAAMRCFVASKLGDEVDVPDELCEGG